MKILVTGGASGLGKAITMRLAKEQGYEVYFTYYSSDENAKMITAKHSNTFSIACDFQNDADIKSLQQMIGDLDIDVLINNAYSGGFIQSYFHKTDSSAYLESFAANIFPTIAITQSAINCFRKKKSGKIITILSSALVGEPPIGASVYVANKAYLAEMTKVWAVENAKFNIVSNSLSPSFMQTAFTKDVDERLVEQIKEQHPSKKLLTPGEVAESVLFLVNAGPEINGTDLVINPVADVV